MKRVVALILGGGQGKRLFPLTMYRSKPAVPIGGKYRLIDIPISNCLHSNIKDIYVLTQYNSESLNNHINNTYRFDYFSRAFVRILAAEQTIDSAVWFQGTADAVRRNIMHLELKGNEDILILSGDHLYDMDYRDFINFHRKKKADFSLSVFPVRASETKEFGIMKLGADDRITGFREKPKAVAELKGLKHKGSYLASMGVYIFNARILSKVLEGNDIDFGREVIPHSIKKFSGYGYSFHGYWRDIGTIRSFYDANIEMALSRSQFSAFYGGSVFTRPRFLPAPRILDTCKIRRAIIAEGSVIENAQITDSVIGLRTTIGKGCKIARTVVMGADYYEDAKSTAAVKTGIGDNSVIEKAIVDKNARIGRNVVIRNAKGLRQFDGDGYFIRDGIVIVPKNAVIKDGTRI
ncbi:MAG: glucose-1-phosphate adenylyltransferase [Candidatus Omnitrophica bacterium]|nr:glucose-1-phosphate adenylyltransferase [Candidatus Omnitrophota bacterium]